MTRVAPVSHNAVGLFHDWRARGYHAGMSYLERYDDVRNNPALLLDGAQTIIMAAFSYANPDAVCNMQSSGNPMISEYALGRDYHKEVRKRLTLAARHIDERLSSRSRVCVDTAPLRERYWAVQCGLGVIGINNYLIIPGLGLHFYLGAILCTRAPDDLPTVSPPKPCHPDCGMCGACIRSCPTGALSADGHIDARRCLSYLTIESCEPLPADVHAGRNLFGCDICRRVCPHQPEDPPTTDIPAFRAKTELLSLSREDWMNMTQEQYDSLTAGTAIRRTTLAHLRDILRRH